LKSECIFTLDSVCAQGEPKKCGQNGTFYQYFGGLGRCGPSDSFQKAVNTSDWKSGKTRGIFSGRLWLEGSWNSEVLQIQIKNKLGAVLGSVLEWPSRKYLVPNATYRPTA